jgi:hypothetical protein
VTEADLELDRPCARQQRGQVDRPFWPARRERAIAVRIGPAGRTYIIHLGAPS